MRSLAAVATFLVLAAPAAAAPPTSITDAPIRTVEAGQGKIGYRIRRSTLGPGTLTIRRMADDLASLIRALRLRRADVLG